MTRTVLIGAALTVALSASAQDNQSWTATDINGHTVSIAALLAQGKTVLVDISAHWCGPCWDWHETGIMEKIYHEFGPEGTNDVAIIFVDGDANSTLPVLNGGPGSQGDWVTGTPYPIIGPNGQGHTIANIYGIQHYPSLYVHCPNNDTGYEIYPTDNWEQFFFSWKSECNSAFNNGAIDAHLLHTDNAKVCPGGHPFADVYNQGHDSLTSATLELKQDGNVLETKHWTGSIAPFRHTTVNFDNAVVVPSTEYEVALTVAGDANPDGNVEEADFGLAPSAPSTLVSLELKTDVYAAQTTWELVDGNDNIVAQDPPGFYTGQTVYNYAWSLDPGECYTFKIHDSSGSGICCSAGTGYYKLKSTWGAGDAFIQGGQFSFNESREFATPTTLGITDNEQAGALNVFPNPTTGLVNIEFAEQTQTTIDLFNVLGERILSSTVNGSGRRTVDMSALSNGVYYMKVTANGETVTKQVTLSK